MSKAENEDLMKQTFEILDKELWELMLHRAKRLSKHRIWLQGLLRFHKIKREYRKLWKIRQLCK